MAVTRKCVCCGREYEYCPNCDKISQPTWKVSFCGETCKDLFNVISAYNTKRVDKSAVQSFVADHGITEVTKYTEPIKKVLRETSATSFTPFTRSGSTMDTYISRRRRHGRR